MRKIFGGEGDCHLPPYPIVLIKYFILIYPNLRAYLRAAFRQSINAPACFTTILPFAMFRGIKKSKATRPCRIKADTEQAQTSVENLNAYLGGLASTITERSTANALHDHCRPKLRLTSDDYPSARVRSSHAKHQAVRACPDS